MSFRLAALAFAAAFSLAAPALAASCGNSASGFAAWKQQFAQEAAQAGVGQRGLSALANTQYAQATIAADRGQKSFKLSYDQFCQKRGCDVIVSQGRKRKAQNPAFYQSLESRYGVPAGLIIAIHGMETGFGNFMGNSNVLNATATLAYDCRRPQFFQPHLVSALVMIDRGMISPGAVGAKHGELGHTQFLPGNALRFGQDGNGDGRIDFNNMSDALASTANYLRMKGWAPGQPYQPGTRNYNVLKEWNAASVYQQALASMGARIDG
ncbi:lytic murein transglycosylase [Tropicimonas isoalkanivorans]|uniref:Transglycosylase SLT domain-containing protein n=1 Tax=Tropicimonas isoalkanivorans TaxID=441112 RepID=A0A1I1E0F1_9RHOB|nr:lytic murein transglycosylase [Tropicimonas isoalkanivorans]SFB80661.1 Transglycosylase SLT domain-containing protein [Tropicimonas isoalkanivorans]